MAKIYRVIKKNWISQFKKMSNLCSYRVRGVDGICAEHLTVESYAVFICQQSYLGLYVHSVNIWSILLFFRFYGVAKNQP